MMPNDPMPSVSLGIIVVPGATYDSHHHHWHASDGVLNASVRFEVGGSSSAHLQGPPAALRGLAAALVDAADQADPPVPAAPVVEGVAQ
jgi:hypothetical protein